MDTMHMGSEPKSHGALIGSIIIVAILVVGGIYYFNSAKQQIAEERMRAEQAALEAEMQADELRQQSDSDSVADIEADLSATDVDSLSTQ